jgi:hypothetical protein
MCLRTSPPGWGGLRRYHVSHGSLRATCFKHKEKPSRPACAASHACSQRTRTSFKGASRQTIMGLQDVQAANVVNTCKACEHASIVRLQYDANTMTTCMAPLQCRVTRQHDATLLIKCSVASDKIRRTHIVEDIICCSYPLVGYCIGFYLSLGHKSGLGSHCNCSALSYKRPGQTPVLGGSLRLFKASSALDENSCNTLVLL